MGKSSSRAVNAATFASLGNGVTLMQASFADHAFERHSHDCFAIGLTTYGVQSFRCKGQRHDSQVGDFVLFNPDEDHDGRPGTDDGFRYTILYVPHELVISCMERDDAPAASSYFARPHLTDVAMARMFMTLSTSLVTTPGESLRVGSLLRAFLQTMLVRHAERPAPDALTLRNAGGAGLARARDYIRAYFQSDMTVSDLATVAGMSRAHLSRAFGETYGTPPHVYLNGVRIARARTLIGLGMPLATVAVECGFADQSHLTRRFKGSVGVTPSDWRAMTGGPLRA